MTPYEIYKYDIKSKSFIYDESQEKVLYKLDILYKKLIKAENNKYFFYNILYKTNILPKIKVKGMYLYGDVGCGKTYLIDTFFKALPFKKKIRIHFHRFMQYIHNELKTLNYKKNPIQIIGKRLSNLAKVICFDEFFVNDITDAMIVSRVLEELFKHNICIIITSNIMPDDLYKNGLQREYFIPTINLLKIHTDIMYITGKDYRLSKFTNYDFFYWPLNVHTEEKMLRTFKHFTKCTHPNIIYNNKLIIQNRQITTHLICNNIVWFKFKELCYSPRSQIDYIELANKFNIVFISNVENMNFNKKDIKQRFMYMVDEFYDRKVKLIISAEVELKKLNSEFDLEFKRTISRLLEMQSYNYLI